MNTILRFHSRSPGFMENLIALQGTHLNNVRWKPTFYEVDAIGITLMARAISVGDDSIRFVNEGEETKAEFPKDGVTFVYPKGHEVVFALRDVTEVRAIWSEPN